jgi:CIC family chloride channel protein
MNLSGYLEKLKDLFKKMKRDDYAFCIIAALVVGLATGIVTVLFIKGIHSLSDMMIAFASDKRWLYFVLPAFGALIVAPIIKYIAPEVKGHGVPDVIMSVAANRGKIRPVVAAAKTVSSIITIGSGGSAGPEGPIVQIGSGIGSSFAQLLGLNERKTITLLAAGAAAGISAVFNAPMAGIMFAAEVVIKKARVKEYGAIIVSSMISSVVSRHFIGDNPVFNLSSYRMGSNWELLLYLLFGAVCAAAAVLFIRILYKTELVFENMKINSILKPVLGALLCGILIYFIPEVYGTETGAVKDALSGNLTIWLLLALLFSKISATSFTVGSGGSGGVFAPLLFVGAMTGGFFSRGLNALFPSINLQQGAYAAVGMAAVFAGAARAPVTSILLICELTRDYHMILPLILATVVSAVLAKKMFKESIYTCKLAAEGINIEEAESRTLLDTISVEEAMVAEKECVKVPAYMPIRDLESYFYMNNVQRAMVVDSRGKLYGIVSIKDLYKRPDLMDSGIVSDICSVNVLAVRENDTLEDAAMIFGSESFHSLPVLDAFDGKKILGMLRREDIAGAYSKILKNKTITERFLKFQKTTNAGSAELLEVRVGHNFTCVDKKLSALNLPDKCMILTIFREKEQIIPDGETEIKAGDNLVVLCPDADKAARILRG